MLLLWGFAVDDCYPASSDVALPPALLSPLLRSSYQSFPCRRLRYLGTQRHLSDSHRSAGSPVGLANGLFRRSCGCIPGLPVALLLRIFFSWLLAHSCSCVIFPLTKERRSADRVHMLLRLRSGSVLLSICRAPRSSLVMTDGAPAELVSTRSFLSLLPRSKAARWIL